MSASFIDNVIVALQEFAIVNISNSMEEVVGKQVTTGVTITNIEKHMASWCMNAKKNNQKPELRPTHG
jgi:hypothetical protein